MQAIGPFQVIRELGRGGMGEVYLARDSRLDRQVAIKALPALLASDPDRFARFQREAKVLASLNHPGIGAIYGIEEAAGQHYLILEYVEGETLAERLTRGAIAVEESLSIARQIAEALEAAHDKGVIHRDLKPGNVMVTAEGVIKVLDFGLARADDHPSSTSNTPFTPDSPTLAPAASTTIPGIILGSPGYMSPEQALGKSVDKRSDIFAFGCVLFEMLTGARAVPGENATAALGAVLHVEPNWAALPQATPPRIRELLTSALSKDRRQRLHDIGDARLALEQAIAGREWTAGFARAPTRARRPVARFLPWALACLLLLVAAGAAWRSRAAPPPRTLSNTGPTRFRVDVPDAPPTIVTGAGSLAVTADGTRVAYTSDGPGGTAFIIIRHMGDAHVQRLARSATGVDFGYLQADLILSPDGSRLASFKRSDLYSTPVDGGESTLVFPGTRNVAPKGGVWGTDGIIFSPAPNAGLLKISDKGGTAKTLTVPDASRGEISHRYPDLLPDGRRVLITVKKEGILTFDDAEIALVDLQTGSWKTILRGGAYARYSPSGHIVFGRNGSIMAAPFDAATGEVTGAPVAVVSGVMTDPGSGATQFAIARDAGSLFYIPGGPDEARCELVWVDWGGQVEPVGAPVMNCTSAAISPDGKRIALNLYAASDAVLVYDLARRTLTRVTYRGNCGAALWMPDGSKIVYASDIDGPMAFYLVSADGTGSPEPISVSGVNENTCLANVDGAPAVVLAAAGDIWLQPFRSEPRRKLVGSQFDETAPHVSPDGRWLSYASDESGQYEVYVRAFPSGENRRQVSIGGGRLHCWAPGGDAIFYIRDADDMTLKAPFRSEPSVDVGQPETMFKWPVSKVTGLQAAPTGRRFLGFKQLPPRFRAEQVFAVLNWFDELKTKVPTAPK